MTQCYPERRRIMLFRITFYERLYKVRETPIIFLLFLLCFQFIAFEAQSQVVEQYVYDLRGRLVSVDRVASTSSIAFSYDSEGNRLSVSTSSSIAPPLGYFTGSLLLPIGRSIRMFPLVPRCSPVSGCPD